MKHSLIRFLDRRIGTLLCAGLTSVRRLHELIWRTRSASDKPKKILFIKWIEQGATVLAYGALIRAIELVGKENVYFSVFDENMAILELLDIIPRENILQLRNKKLTLFLLDMLKSLWKIRRLKIDATVDLEFFARASAVFGYLTGARIRVGLHRFASEAPYRGDLMTHRVQYNPYLHITMSYRLLVDALLKDPADQPMLKATLPIELPQAKFLASEADLRQALIILQKFSSQPLNGQPIILLNPNASDLLPLRKWPTERFVALGLELLAREPDAVLVLTGASSEAAGAEHVMRELKSDRVFSIAGKTTLRELIMIYSLAQVLVTNDSGPAHFASLTPIAAVTLFGPETPKLFGAVAGDPHILWAGLACSPCVSALNHRKSTCINNLCMQAIGVDDVASKVRELLARNRASKSRPRFEEVRRRSG